MPLAIANLKLDSSSPLPIYQQIAQGIRTAVWSHQLSPGALLPTIKELAQHLNVARNTIALAYVHLVDEGVCVSNTRRGTRVATDNPSLCPDEVLPETSPTSTATFSAAFNARHALETHVNRVGGGIPLAFRVGPYPLPQDKARPTPGRQVHARANDIPHAECRSVQCPLSEKHCRIFAQHPWNILRPGSDRCRFRPRKCLEFDCTRADRSGRLR